MEEPTSLLDRVSSLVEKPRWDWAAGAIATAALWFGPWLPGITRPPAGSDLAAFMDASASDLWALFAGLLAGMIFFYTLVRGPAVENAEDRWGNALFSSWCSSLGWTLALALTATLIISPLNWVAWPLVFAWTMVAIKAIRVIVLVLSFVKLMRRDWSTQRRREHIEKANTPTKELERTPL